MTRIPTHVWLGLWILAAMAGIVNAVGLLSFQQHAVAHLTGNASLLAIDFATGDTANAARVAAIIGCFTGGCVISGLIIRGSAFQLGRLYGVALSLESGCLLAAIPLLNEHASSGICVLAVACGLQNAMMSTYSGSVIRTTHVSGMFTDLGIYLGHALRGIPVDLLRVRLCIVVITGFFAGGCVGALGMHHYHHWILLLPASAAALIGGTYTLQYRQRKSPSQRSQRP